MTTHEIAEAWKREQRQSGIQEGRLEGYQLAVLTVHEARFGVLQEDLAALVRAEHDVATLRDWLNLTGTGTADEVASRLRASREATEPLSAPTPSAG